MESTLETSIELWAIFAVIIGVSMAVDLGLIDKIRHKKRTEQPSDDTKIDVKKAAIWTAVWISLAGVFAVIIGYLLGSEKMLEFVTGYTLEKSLSVDNMFVFLLIFSTLKIPHRYQHRVLSVGIMSAIAMRIGIILVGASLLEEFHWMIYVFGGMLWFTSIRMLLQKEEKKIDVEKNIAVRIIKKFVPVKVSLVGEKFFVRAEGKLYATSLLVALAIIELTDLVFAMDSIPAVLAITTDPLIVITSNIFAIFGLRALYFLLGGVMEKFYYLKPGLIILLFFIGTKMIISEFFHISTEISLMVVFGILGTVMLASLARAKRLSKKEK